MDSAHSAPANPPRDPAPSGVELAPGVWCRGEALRVHFARSGGPGGQNVNKVNTKADLHLAIADIRGLPADAIARLIALAGRRVTKSGDLHLVGEVARTQQQNLAHVMEELRQLLLASKKRPKVRRATRPSRASKERRLVAKKTRSNIKKNRRPGSDA